MNLTKQEHDRVDRRRYVDRNDQQRTRISSSRQIDRHSRRVQVEQPRDDQVRVRVEVAGRCNVPRSVFSIDTVDIPTIGHIVKNAPACEKQTEHSDKRPPRFEKLKKAIHTAVQVVHEVR